MVTICQTCGDQGFPEALVYCSHCNISAQHRYCLGTHKIYFVEDIMWLCEECGPCTSISAISGISPTGLYHSNKLENDIKYQVTELEKKQVQETGQKRQPNMADNEQKKSGICNSDELDLHFPDSGFSNQPCESQCSIIAVEDKESEEESGKLGKSMTLCTMEVASHTESKPIIDPVCKSHEDTTSTTLDAVNTEVMPTKHSRPIRIRKPNPRYI